MDLSARSVCLAQSRVAAMKTALDSVLHFGTTRIAAISLTSSGAREFKTGAFLQGSKQPLALLMLDEGGVAAYAATGQRLSIAEIERLCPGAVAAFLAAGP